MTLRPRLTVIGKDRLQQELSASFTDVWMATPDYLLILAYCVVRGLHSRILIFYIEGIVLDWIEDCSLRLFSSLRDKL
jgi:hypothetical protein